MAITTFDGIAAACAGGRRIRSEWNKSVGAFGTLAGRHYDLSAGAGYPGVNAWSGTALTFQECDQASGFSILHGGNVSPSVKHVLDIGASAAQSPAVPSTVTLVDIEGYWPGISNNTTLAQALSGTPVTRATNGDGLRLYLVQTASGGGAVQNLSLSYTNQAGTSGRALPVTVTIYTSPTINMISHSGVNSGNYAPFLPMASGDYGVQNVASVTFSVANTGTSALVLARPIAEIPIGIISGFHSKNLISQFASLPIVPDGACLSLVLAASGSIVSNSIFTGSVDFIWG